VVGEREPLVLDRPGDVFRELAQPRRPRGRIGVELEPVLADVDQLVDPDDATRVVAGTPAHAGNERIPPVQPAELLPGLFRDARVLGPVDDRREHAVDVEHDRRALGRLPQPLEQLVRLHAPTIRG
jgi:hypothetical protein